MKNVQSFGLLAVLAPMLSLLVAGTGCAVDATYEGDEDVAQAAQAICPNPNLPNPPPPIDTTFSAVNGACGVAPLNQTCDGAGNAYYGAVNAEVDCLTNLSNAEQYEASMYIEYTTWSSIRDAAEDAGDWETVSCIDGVLYPIAMRLSAVNRRIMQLESECAFAINAVAQTQCEFARCMTTNECHPTVPFPSGASGAGCT